MSHVDLNKPIEVSNNQHPQSFGFPKKSSILKISLVVFGLLLIAASITSHLYQVNTIAVGVMGGAGGLLIVGTLITSIVQCISERREEARQEEEELRQREAERALEQQALEEQTKWYNLAKNGDMNIIKEAIENETLAEPNRLLHGAASGGHSDLVSLLIANGADPRQTAQYDYLGYSALHLAEACHDTQKGLETMRVLLDYDPTLVSVKTQWRNLTALHMAAMGGIGEEKNMQTQKIELLIQKGAELNVVDSELSTPLHELAAGNAFGVDDRPNLELIEILVHAGADWNAKNGAGMTPLQVAQTRHKEWCATPEIQTRLSALH